MKGIPWTRNCTRTQKGEYQYQEVYMSLNLSYCKEQDKVYIYKSLTPSVFFFNLQN